MDAADELQDLWAAVFSEPPFIRAEPQMMAKILVHSLPLAPPYEVERPASSQAVPTFTSRRGAGMGG